MHLERLENRGLVTVQNVWRLHRIGNFHTINSCVLQGQSSRAHIRIPIPLKHHDLHLGPNGPLSPNPYTRHRWLINNHKIPLRFRTTYNPSIQRNKQSRSPQCNYMTRSHYVCLVEGAANQGSYAMQNPAILVPSRRNT